MLRQVSSRNHRAKGGFRAKNALQISTLVAVGIWLIYQMKYSHDHKLHINARQSELTSFSRKEAEHGEIKEKAREAEPSEQKYSQIAQKADGREHEEHSHEAREKSFRGDDASSEVVVHNTQETERDERTREARERSFKADDASSAVDHIVPLKDSEPEINGMFVSVREKNTSLVQFNQTLPESRAAANETALEDEHASSVGTEEKFHADESASQDELGLRSRENVQKDYTVILKNSTRAQSNQIVERDLQNLTAVLPLQTSTEAAKLEVATTENEVMAKKSDDQNLNTSVL